MSDELPVAVTAPENGSGDTEAEDLMEQIDNTPWIKTWVKMKKQGLRYEAAFSFEFLVENLGCPVDGQLFGHYIRKINNQLQHDGYHLRQESANRRFVIGTEHECWEWCRHYRRVTVIAAERENALLIGLLGNQSAKFTQEERDIMQDEQNRAAWRLQFLQNEERQRWLQQRHPNLVR